MVMHTLAPLVSSSVSSKWSINSCSTVSQLTFFYILVSLFFEDSLFNRHLAYTWANITQIRACWFHRTVETLNLVLDLKHRKIIRANFEMQHAFMLGQLPWHVVSKDSWPFGNPISFSVEVKISDSPDRASMQSECQNAIMNNERRRTVRRASKTRCIWEHRLHNDKKDDGPTMAMVRMTHDSNTKHQQNQHRH